MVAVKCKRESFCKLCALFWIPLLGFVCLLQVGAAVKIKHLFVPDSVDITSPDPIKLECIIESDTNDNTSKLVAAQWYLNDELLYQWSAGRKLYINGTFAGRLDPRSINGTYVSGKTVSVPLVIIKKSKDLSGTYRCQAETSTEPVSEETNMTTYVPVNNITLYQVFDNTTNELNVTCGAEDVYPRPKIILYVNDETMNITDVDLDVRVNENQLFNISATYVVQLSESQSVTKINCSVALPDVSLEWSRLTQYDKSGEDGDGNGNANISKNAQGPQSTGVAHCSGKRGFNLLLLSMLAIVLFERFVR